MSKTITEYLQYVNLLKTEFKQETLTCYATSKSLFHD